MQFNAKQVRLICDALLVLQRDLWRAEQEFGGLVGRQVKAHRFDVEALRRHIQSELKARR